MLGCRDRGASTMPPSFATSRRPRAGDCLERPSLNRFSSHFRRFQTMPRGYTIHTLLTHDQGNLLEIGVDDLAGEDRTGYADQAPSSAEGSMRYPRRRSNSRYFSETSASW